MRRPLTFGQLHVCEYGTEGRIFRAAGIDSETDFSIRIEEVAATHLVENVSVLRVFQTKIILSAAQAKPHGFFIGRNFHSRPVGISVIRCYASKMLEAFIFIFNGGFQPGFTVQIKNHAALVEAMFAVGKIGFHDKGKNFSVVDI